MIKAIFFDLDGTLLPMEEEKVFVKQYFRLLCGKFLTLSVDKDVFMNAMMTNEVAFWQEFEKFFPNGKQKYIHEFEKFYVNEFKNLKEICGENPLARKVVHDLKSKYKLVLATNPLFPEVAINTRLGFVELEVSDFDYVSTYENSTFSKSNPRYFEEILKKLGLAPNEVLLFGNEVVKDAEFASKLS